MVKEVKMLAEKPTLRGFLLLMVKPLITYALSKILASTVRPYLKPISLPPVTPPSPPTIPEFHQIERYMSDHVIITDKVVIEITPILLASIRDALSISDEVTILLELPALASDEISIVDETLIAIGHSVLASDEVTISDEVAISLELAPLASDTLDIADEVTVSITPGAVSGNVYVNSTIVGDFTDLYVGATGDVFVDTKDVGDFNITSETGYVYVNGTQVGTYSLSY